MFYDHKTDPEENTNLSEKQEYAQLVNSLAGRLKEKRGTAFLKSE